MIKKLIQPYLDILSHDLKTFVRNLHKKKSIRLEQALKELEFNRKKIDKLEDDFEKFGSFISEFSRLTDYKVVEPQLMEEEKKEIGEQAIRMVGEDMGWEDSTEHYIKNWKNLTK